MDSPRSDPIAELIAELDLWKPHLKRVKDCGFECLEHNLDQDDVQEVLDYFRGSLDELIPMIRKLNLKLASSYQEVIRYERKHKWSSPREPFIRLMTVVDFITRLETCEVFRRDHENFRRHYYLILQNYNRVFGVSENVERSCRD